MTDKKEVLEALEHAFENDAGLDQFEGVHTQSLDLQSTDRTVSFPALEVKIVGDPRVDEQPGFVRYVRDEDNSAIGVILEWTFEARIEVSVWIPRADRSYNVHSLGADLKLALGRYDDLVYDDILLSPDGEAIEEISSFRVGDGRPDNRRGGSGGLMDVWRQTVYVEYAQRVNTVERYGPFPVIEVVRTPDSTTVVAEQDGERQRIKALPTGF